MSPIQSLLIIILLFLGPASLQAQSNNATLLGKVTDETGKPLELANVSLKNSAIGTVSNRDGAYLLRIPAKKTVLIVYSMVGYQSVEKTIKASEEQKLELNIALKQIDQEIDEVQVTQHLRNKTNMDRIAIYAALPLCLNKLGTIQSNILACFSILPVMKF